ncbi:hypothetical protein KKB40_03910 [Patescibacteria group bacterium]|nr:hypothetical protein [Patescibacteria group bacterium]
MGKGRKNFTCYILQATKYMGNVVEFLSGMKILEDIKSPINGQVTVVKNLGMKPYIQVGGLTQSGGVVRGVWRSTLKKLKSKNLPAGRQGLKPITCLILGLGGGTVAGLVRKFWPEAKITGVEIDPIFVALGKKYLGLDKVGVDIKIQDAEEFMAQSLNLPAGKAGLKAERYDLILVDMYVGDEVPKQFETENYIHRARKFLARGGVIVFNRLYYGTKRSEAVKFGKLLEKVFSKVTVHYPEANLMFICSS